MRLLRLAPLACLAVTAALSVGACSKKDAAAEPAHGDSAHAAPESHGDAGGHGEPGHGTPAGDGHGDGHGAAPSGPTLAHWGYVGDEGPTHWAQLGGAAALCGAGKRQSPIDLAGARHPTHENLTLDYTSSQVTVQNNGHTVVVTPVSGGGIKLDGVLYTLKQFHFHTPSEHAINAHRAAFETHFVHQNAHGDYLVLGVMSEVGTADPMLAPLWAYLPSSPGSPLNVPDLLINARDLMPTPESFYAYAGSLTTPPCTEGITWMVFTTPLTVSSEQVQSFEGLIGPSARPLQQANGRRLLAVN